jgi:hypothetical protein
MPTAEAELLWKWLNVLVTTDILAAKKTARCLYNVVDY